MFATGVLNMIIGVIAFSLPMYSTFGFTVVLGGILVVGGLLQLAHGIQLVRHVGNGWRVLHAIISVAAGTVILRYPEAGMLGMAIALTFYFTISAAAKWMVALGMRPHRGWGWVFASGTTSFLIAAFVLVTFPVSALWLPGFLVGIDLVVLGGSLIGFSLDLKNFHQNAVIRAQ